MSCRFDGHPPGVLPELSLEEQTLDVSLDAPVAMLPSPDATNDVLVLERDGRIWRLSDPDAPISGRLIHSPASHVAEAIGMATSVAHPNHIVVAFRTTGDWIRVARFDLADPIDPSSELVIMSSARTETAAITFDATGLLYVAFGDSTGEAMDSVDAQDPSTLEGTVSRIDISTLDGTGTYSVPPDNPNATALGGDGGVSRAWAVGLRAPFACTHDGWAAWCADGGLTVSEVHQVPASKDLGWPDHDGNRCLAPSGCSLELERYPQAAVDRDDASCGIVGIQLYDGERYKSLAPSLIYADSCKGELHALLLDAPDDHLWRGPLISLPSSATGMGRDKHGEVYLLTANPGTIQRVVTVNEEATFPSLLSESGCFDDVESLSPSAGVIPYAVNSPLWSDGSFKQRFIEVPPSARIIVGEADSPWSYPVGTVLVKTFSYTMAGTTEPAPVEIRVMVLRAHGWEFHSYRYDEALRDAVLLDDDDQRLMEVDTSMGVSSLAHGFPSRFSCTVCHRVDDARVIGAGTAQWNRVVEFDDGPNHQLAAMEAIGLFENGGDFVDPSLSIALTRPEDQSADIASRARAYLHANCAHCHRPDGWVPPNLFIDLRYDVALEDTATCEEPTKSGANGVIIAPGDPDGSRLYERMATRDNAQMPPLATELVDDAALAIVRGWLAELPPCP
jgi:uncharacterized repeat protein (TIGR03806 family)